MLILSQSQVRELLTMRDCIEVVGEAMAGLARGEGVQPLRGGFLLPDQSGVLAWMPGSLAAGQIFGVKILSIVMDPGAVGVDSHQGGVLIFDAANGAPLALLEAGAITAVRTAAVSALATDLLARQGASTLAILGTGTQARSHVEAMLAVRPITRVRVWGRNPKKAQAFGEEQAARHGVIVEPAASAAAAVAGADIVCTTTSAREPVFFGHMMERGMHVNAVGASIPLWQELDTEAVARSRLFTDRRESLEKEAGEYIRALATGAIADGHLQAELGEVLTGAHPGRTSDAEITLFRSLGLAVQDIAAGKLVYERALAAGIGTKVDLAG